MKKTLALLMMVMPLFVVAKHPAIVIVQDGIAKAEIVLAEKPTRAAQMGAFEFQHLVHLITGVELPIVYKTTTGKIPIYIGGAAKNEFTGEKYSVSVTPEKIRLAGHDSEDYATVDYSDWITFPGTGYNYKTPRNIYNFHSTLYAVYDFFEFLCGVRFYSYGDLGIAHEKRDTLAVKPFERVYEPKADAFRYNGFSFRDRKGPPDRDRRLLQLRWRLNTLFGETNHTTDSLIWRYWGPARGYESVFIEKRPQYFIKGYDKMPTGDSAALYPPDNKPPAQLCITHPDVAKYFAWEANEVFTGGVFRTPPLTGVRFRFMKKMEGKPFYYPVQEGDNQYWCKCDDCLKLFPDIDQDRRYTYLHFDFINRVAREAGKIDPQINISTLAYHDSMHYPDPELLPIEKNVAVQICLGVHSWMFPDIYNHQHGIYKTWVKNEIDKRPVFVWTYMLSPESEAFKSYKYINFFPVQYPWKVASYYKEFMNDGIRGVFLELSGRYNLLEGYIAMRTAFDPDYDSDALIDEYFRLYYKEAAAPMKRFFQKIEEIVYDPKNYPEKEITDFLRKNLRYSTAMGIHTQKVNWSLGTAERMRMLQGIVDEAQLLVRSPDAQERLGVFLRDIWEPALKGRLAYEQRLDVEKNPLPKMAAYQLKGKNDTFELIDWSLLETAQPTWWNLRLIEETTPETSPSIKSARDEQYVFLHYSESGSQAWDNRDASLWDNYVDIFFADTDNFPVKQIAVGANGEIKKYARRIYDGVDKIEAWNSDVQLAYKLTASGWEWTLAIPRQDFPVSAAGMTRINFIRTRKNADPIAWSYLNPSSYIEGLFRMGELYFPPLSKAQTYDVNGDFSRRDKQGQLAGWLQNRPALSVGLFCHEENGKVTMSCPSDNVHFMTLRTDPLSWGDKIVFEFTASGTGNMLYGSYFYTYYKTGRGLFWKTAQNTTMPVSTSPQRYRVVLDTATLPDKDRNIMAFRPFLGALKGAEITISEIAVELIPGDSSAHE